MKKRLRSVILLCLLMTSCSTNAPTMPTSVRLLATEAKIPTVPSAQSLLPTPTSTQIPVSPIAVPTQARTARVCTSSDHSNYCPQTDCHKDECLFVLPSAPNYPVGIATVRGYYAKVEQKGFGETKICDSFVIVEGSQVLIDAYLSLIEAGNTVNNKNELNQPIINLDLNVADAQDKQRILASNKDNTAEVLLLSPIPRGMGVSACYSSVEIITVD